MLDKEKKPTVLALGYFDSVHLGHRQVIDTAKELANTLGCTLTVFTFKGNLKSFIDGSQEKSVYLPSERQKLLYEAGADDIFFAPVDFNFLSLGKLAFLNILNKSFDIKGYVCGKDYRFARFAKGGITDLEKYAVSHGQKLVVVDTVNLNGEKISTTAIKKMLDGGDIKNANYCLSKPFGITATVKSDRKVGRTLGFPTANLEIDKDKQLPKEGVYAGYSVIDGVKYKAIINCGKRPTFNDDTFSVEGYLQGFTGDLYGKEITFYFTERLRDIKKFDTKEQLKEQLDKDLKNI